MRIDEINAMAEEVYLEHENNDILYGDSLELRLTYKAGVVDGYNKAKETLYTETQVLQLLLRLQQTESYDNLYEWFEQFKK
jgi:hypothetical protein